MSQSTNTSVINFCDVCNLSFESKKALYRHQSYDLIHKELLEKMFDSEEEEISEVEETTLRQYCSTFLNGNCGGGCNNRMLEHF